jgi:mono/diheme cytochrome c family protein
MRKLVKWGSLIVGLVIVVGFVLFLYVIPPFTLSSPETFSAPEQSAAPAIDSIADSADRAIAERGRYLVVVGGCTGCHTASGPDGAPNWKRYLAGGGKFIDRENGTVYAANITPDVETGIGKLSRVEVMHMLKTGQKPDGTILNPRAMPWPDFSNLPDEDLFAIATYLHYLKPIRSRVPGFSAHSDVGDPAAKEAVDLSDFSAHE